MTTKTITEQIASKIDYIEFYSEYVKNIKETGKDQYIGLCPMHNDTQPSFSFNSETGKWNCFAGCGEGNVFTFLEKHLNINSGQERLEWLCNYLKIPFDNKNTQGVIDKEIYMACHKALLNNFGMLTALKEKRGIELKTIKYFKLGQHKNRITIPIFDEEGRCRNIRYYAFGNTKVQNKMVSHKDDTPYNYGSMRLFPITTLLKHQKVIIFEGEMDMILAHQLGIPAITVTGGATSFSNSWAPKYFKDKIVYVCHDIDDAGRAGSLKKANLLFQFTKQVFIIDLKEAITDSKIKGADFTNYIMDYNYTLSDFKILASQTKEFIKVEVEEKTLRRKDYKKVNLSQSSHAVNAMANIEVKALVSGKDYPPFEVPDKVSVECDGKAGDKLCPFCPLYNFDKHKTDVFLSEKIQNGSLLGLIDIPDTVLFGNIRKQIGIPAKCNHLRSKVRSYINVEELRLIPEIDFSADENYEYVQQVAYFAGHGIKTNQVYTLKGIALPNPKTQQATCLFHEATPTIDSIDLFKNDEETKQKLEKFRTGDSKEALNEYFSKRYRDLEEVSGIYERNDIALAYDIALHSSLNFMFQGKLERGWMEMLLIGDSGCGKTELAKAMINTYKVGEFVTGESSTIAGLLGGLSQTSKKWHINWGKIPLNNRRALFIDEFSGMTVEDIALLSGVRSSGIAELTKIRTEKTLAQTRKIMIGNPRKMGQNSRAMMEYPFGVIAVKELIGNLEDIRRFDFVMTAHSSEVDPNVYNRRKKEPHERYFSDLDFHTLIMWVWSRKTDQVKFTHKAVNKVLELASVMAKDYYHGIPIVEPADQRLKLARGAASIAGMTYSTRNGNDLVVTEKHVEFFHNFIDTLYRKESLRYKEWSDREFKRKTLKNLGEVNIVITNELVAILLDNNLEFINLSSLIDFTGFERDRAKRVLSTLLKNNGLIRVGYSGYRKTEALIDYLNKRIRKEIIVEDQVEEEAPF